VLEGVEANAPRLLLVFLTAPVLEGGHCSMEVFRWISS
jgi:hypothetical protein